MKQIADILRISENKLIEDVEKLRKKSICSNVTTKTRGKTCQSL